MPYNGLADLLETLEQQRELARVEVQVDSCGELTEVAGRASGDTIDRGGPALLFSRLTGHDWPVVANLFGTESRLAQALGAESCEELTERLEAADQAMPPAGMFDRLKRLGASGKSAPLGTPRIVKSARCQQVVELGRDIDLTTLPLLRRGADGERAAITAGQLIARQPGGSTATVLNAPSVVLESNRLGLVWYPASELARYWSIARERGEALPVAIVLGACPSWAIVGEVPLPLGWDCYAYAAALRGAPIELVKGRTQPIDVPADAEIILEGTIDTSADFVPLGNFVTPLGQGSPPLSGPAIEVTAVTHRANPVLPIRAPGWPWHESAVLRRVSLRLLLPAAQQIAPDLTDYDAPLFGAGRTLFVAVAKRFAGQGAQVAAALRGWPPTSGAKMLVLVDEEIDVRDPARVWGQVVAECDPARDFLSYSGPADPLDPAQSGPGLGQTIAIDATRKLAGERANVSPIEPRVSAEILDRVLRRWDEYGLAAVAKTGSRC